MPKKIFAQEEINEEDLELAELAEKLEKQVRKKAQQKERRLRLNTVDNFESSAVLSYGNDNDDDDADDDDASKLVGLLNKIKQRKLPQRNLDQEFSEVAPKAPSPALPSPTFPLPFSPISPRQSPPVPPAGECLSSDCLEPEPEVLEIPEGGPQTPPIPDIQPTIAEEEMETQTEINRMEAQKTQEIEKMLAQEDAELKMINEDIEKEEEELIAINHLYN